jgi:hypothetical protein
MSHRSAEGFGVRATMHRRPLMIRTGRARKLLATTDHFMERAERVMRVMSLLFSLSARKQDQSDFLRSDDFVVVSAAALGILLHE